MNHKELKIKSVEYRKTILEICDRIFKVENNKVLCNKNGNKFIGK